VNFIPIDLTPLQDDYEDGRFSEIPDSYEANLGRMPCLKLGEESLGQSGSINFYLATELGLMGSSSFEAAKILSIQESLAEMFRSWYTIISFGVAPTEADWDKWFTSGATDTEGKACREDSSQRYAIWYAGRIEKLLNNAATGYAVGDKLSLADVLIYNIFAGELKPAETGEDVPAYRTVPFGNKERTDAFLEAYPNLRASIAAVASNENIQKWLATRGVQYF
jgi:glutathione S-transferase